MTKREVRILDQRSSHSGLGILDFFGSLGIWVLRHSSGYFVIRHSRHAVFSTYFTPILLAPARQRQKKLQQTCNTL